MICSGHTRTNRRASWCDVIKVVRVFWWEALHEVAVGVSVIGKDSG